MTKATMIQYQDSSNNHFPGLRSERARAKRIGKVDPVFYLADDGSVYVVINCGPFQKYKQIVEADNEPEYEICKECGKVHNEIANRTYHSVPFSPFTNKRKVIAAPPESNDEKGGTLIS